MIFSFEKINRIEGNKYEYVNAKSVRTIPRSNLEIINNLYKEYIGCDFPRFEIYSIDDGNVIISINSNIETIRFDTLINLSSIYLHKNDKRVMRVKRDIDYLRNKIVDGYFLFNAI